MIVQKTYKCEKCKNTFVKSESEKVVKSVLPSCPLCGATEVKLDKTLVVGNKPNS